MSPPNNVWPLSCGIHAANAFHLHDTRALVVESSGWPTSFASSRGGVGHTTRWQFEMSGNSQEIAADLLERGHKSFCAAYYEDACGQLTEALAHFRQMPPSTELATCLYWLENSAAMFEERPLDPAPFIEALPLFREAGLHYMAATCCDIIADSAISDGHLSRAEGYLGLAKELFADSDSWTGVPRTTRKFAELALLKGNQDEAILLHESALEQICAQPQGLQSVQYERRQIENFGARRPT